jgi:citrate synthase
LKYRAVPLKKLLNNTLFIGPPTLPRRGEAPKQREYAAVENAAQRDHEAAERQQRHAAELLPQQLDWIATWRAELQKAAHVWDDSGSSQPPETLVGQPWFETFRAYLSDSDSDYAAVLTDKTAYATEQHYANDTTQCARTTSPSSPTQGGDHP